MLRTLLPAALAAFTLLLTAQPAHAVTYNYCEYSLRGGGSLAGDDDIRRQWNIYQARGLDIVASWPSQWYGPNGADLVQVRWSFQRRSGWIETAYFGCSGSGSGYWDGWLS